MGKPAAARLRDHLDVAEVIIPDWLLVFVEEEQFIRKVMCVKNGQAQVRFLEKPLYVKEKWPK